MSVRMPLFRTAIEGGFAATSSFFPARSSAWRHWSDINEAITIFVKKYKPGGHFSWLIPKYASLCKGSLCLQNLESTQSFHCYCKLVIILKTKDETWHTNKKCIFLLIQIETKGDRCSAAGTLEFTVKAASWWWSVEIQVVIKFPKGEFHSLTILNIV